MTAKVLPFYQDVDGFRLPGVFSADIYRAALNYKPTAEDFFIATFPKCGTTWVQQIVTLIFNEGKSVKDYMEFTSRSPYLELCGLEGIEKMKRPGSIKTHLPFHMTPYSSETKYLYVARNPKDALVSFFHVTNSDMYRFEDGTFDDYFDLYVDGKTDYEDYFEHVLGWYEHRNDENVLLITYEELKLNTRSMIKKIAGFMGPDYAKKIEDEEFLDEILKYSSMDHMKGVFNDTFDVTSDKNILHQIDPEDMLEGLKHLIAKTAEYQSENRKSFKYVRKGIVGDWRIMFTDEQNQIMDEKIEDKIGHTELYAYWRSIDCLYLI